MIKAERCSTAAVPILIWIKSTQRRVNGSLNLHETAHQGMKRRGRVLRGREEKRRESFLQRFVLFLWKNYLRQICH